MTPLYPEQGASLTVPAGVPSATHFLPDSLELTGAGLERIIVLLSDQPIDVEVARQAARAAYDRAGGDLGRSAAARPAGRTVHADVRQAVNACAGENGRRIPRWPLPALAALLALLVAGGARADVLHRFAVIAGNDSGGADTRPLLYASADASKVYDILTRLGGVRTEDANLIIDGGASDVLSALGKVERQAAEAARHGEHTALFFYYSGHAKDGALRLGESRLPIDALKGLVAAAPVDVRIVILDSCRSGSITRSKGARKAPAFAIESESPRDAKGMVILTSSASDEDSQESDAIGGSYFSHHLASGLLGGADKSGDGQVTLFEAYAYAYDRTVADTAESAAGAQHPTFSYDLAGNGDLVLTDVVSRHEGIYLPRQAPSGVYFLVDRQGFVAAEINKGDGVDRRVALSPGRYRVKRRLADRLRVGEIDVPRGELVTLEEGSLRDAPFSADPVKGAAAST